MVGSLFCKLLAECLCAEREIEEWKNDVDGHALDDRENRRTASRRGIFCKLF